MNKDQVEKIFQQCPQCGEDAIEFHEDGALRCPDCEFTFFINPAPTSTAIITNTEGQILLVKRARDPQKGMWDLPGGFIDLGETAETALQRELQEELGVDAEKLEYFGSWVNTYDYKDVPYVTLDLIFVATVTQTPRVVDEHEISEMQWMEPEQIAIDKVAFPSLRAALRAFIDRQ